MQNCFKDLPKMGAYLMSKINSLLPKMVMFSAVNYDNN